MSTILKALRRLEDEEDAKVEAKATRVAADAGPEVAADLRERIFAEEAAAQALGPESAPPSAATGKIVIGVSAIAAVLLIGFASNWYVESNPRSDANAVATALATDPAAAPGQATAPARPLAPPTPESQRTAASVARTRIAAVVEKPSPNTGDSALAASAKPQGLSAPTWPSGSAMAARSGDLPNVANSPAARSAPLEADSIAPAVAGVVEGADVDIRGELASAPVASSPRAAEPTPGESAAQPKVAPLAIAAVRPTPAASSSRKPARSINSLPEATESPTADSSSRAESISRPTNRSVSRPRDGAQPSPSAKVAAAPPPTLAETRALPAAEVDRIDHRGLPDVVVVRTAWHPKPDRRSAKIRLVASDETLNLKEGDAVGGMVVQEITPSTVLFAAGEVEIRRKVGATR